MEKYYEPNYSLEDLTAQVHKDFPGAVIEPDTELRFYEFFIPEILSGQKDCTIRFRPGKLRLPAYEENQDTLPCYATSPDDATYKKLVGDISIDHILVSTVKHFPLWAAQQDGYDNLEDMKKDIGEIYGVTLQPQDYLSMYTLGIFTPRE